MRVPRAASSTLVTFATSGEWSSGRSGLGGLTAVEAFTASSCQQTPVSDGTKVVVAFVAARSRDTVAIVDCTLEGPHAFPIRIWEESENVDPSDVADELRAVWSRYYVRDLLVSEHDWSWVMLELAEEGLPVTKVPRSPQRLALQWSQFYDAVLERRLSHDGDRVLSRHVSDLSLVAGPSRPRPDMDVAEGQPIAAALAVMIAYDVVTRLGPGVTPIIVLPTGVG